MTSPLYTPPSPGDAALLTLSACTLMASEYPRAATPDQAKEFAAQAVDVVMAVWGEIQLRIASGVLITPSE